MMSIFKRTHFLSFLFCLLCILFSGCNKKQTVGGYKPSEPLKPEVGKLEQDITALGKLVVNKENESGSAASEGSSRLIDNSPDTKFLIKNYDHSFYMEIEFPNPQQVSAYTLTSGNDYGERDPQNWTITGSVDGKSWVELNTQHYEFFPNRKQVKRYNFKNEVAYKIYRFNVKEIGAGNIFQLAEWRLIQVPVSKQLESPKSNLETIVADVNTLLFIDKSDGLNPMVKEGLITVFKANYKKMKDIYNPNASTKVIFSIDPAYDGVAAAFGGGIIRYDPKWFKNNPADIDVATHELMHVVQSYNLGITDTGWITEGIADYVRYTLGYDNLKANWALPNFSVTEKKYRESYRVTARFFAWLEKHGYAGIVIKLDRSMRDGSYKIDTFWTSNANGKSIDQLWEDYATNPTL